MGVEELQILTDVTLAQKASAYRQGANDTTKQQIVDGIITNFNNSFSNIFEMTDSSTKDYQAAFFYDTRTKDFKQLQDAVAARTGGETENLDADIQNARRQSQINEWSAYNKLDTLFISQLTFIGLVFLAPLLYLKTLYIIPSGVFWGIAFLIFIIVLFTIVFRVQYTDKSRSNRFWHRRRFGVELEAPKTVCI
jgi:hypothetical protein